MHELPKDFNDPFYNHIKNDVRGMLAGALGTTHFSEESALARVRNIMRAEHGYSDELVQSMPEWRARYAAPVVPTPAVIVDNAPASPAVQTLKKQTVPANSKDNKN